jgi:geranylgeranyl diphosphate synthase type I
MIYEIKKQIERELLKFVQEIDKTYSLSKISPLLFKHIKDFVLRDGKRIRPMLFIIGYKGFSNKIAGNLFTTALAIELLHDFLLVHDDIIDKSDTRRGKPSMHAMFNNYLAKNKDARFSGQDLAIIVGDVMYAMAIHAFLSIKEKTPRKEKALKKFIMAAMLTGSGEFIELIHGSNDIMKISKKDILRVYDYKTAYYTFSSPLSTGAILAGASQSQVDKLFNYGKYLGRAFQIKDDVLSMFGDENKIGKSSLTDIKESKKTLLLWHAYNKSSKKDKSSINNILAKEDANKHDLSRLRNIMIKAGSLEYANKEISRLIKNADNIQKDSTMKPRYKELLNRYVKDLLNLNL